MMMLRSLVLAVACLSTSAVALADKPTFEVKDNRLVLPGPVVFETASAKLKPESDKVLAHVKAYLEDKTAEGRAANRRSEFVNAALRGRAIGGMPADGGGADAGDVCK
ncbi:MAG: hypothetical protein NT062_37045 [Proteobacteria bacterium]|nr:hypothetical protein [Pseudomonadota bacterium]